jgi:hypothetical protein
MASNMRRISLLVPVMLAHADHVGLTAGRQGRTGIVLAVGFATFMLSTSILRANVPNLVMAGTAETIHGLHFADLPYLLRHAPVLGVLRGLVPIGAILMLFPDNIEPAEVSHQAKTAAALSAAELRLSAILVVTLAPR